MIRASRCGYLACQQRTLIEVLSKVRAAPLGAQSAQARSGNRADDRASLFLTLAVGRPSALSVRAGRASPGSHPARWQDRSSVAAGIEHPPQNV
jgi:hypothetical protein